MREEEAKCSRTKDRGTDYYKLWFAGYIIEPEIDKIPNESGIYLVYRCKYKAEEGAVHLEELIHIGAAQDMRGDLTPTKIDGFKKECKEGEILCFSHMSVEPSDLELVENALIFIQKPRLNDSHKDRYNYATPVIFRLCGHCSLMKYFNVVING